MAEGWACPVCRRGVAPGEKSCDHGGERAHQRSPFAPISVPTPFFPRGHKPKQWGRCGACKDTGICGCYRPDRDSTVCSAEV